MIQVHCFAHGSNYYINCPYQNHQTVKIKVHYSKTIQIPPLVLVTMMLIPPVPPLLNLQDLRATYSSDQTGDFSVILNYSLMGLVHCKSVAPPGSSNKMRSRAGGEDTSPPLVRKLSLYITQ